jgi:rhodanese-related sulfurtransferase
MMCALNLISMFLIQDTSMSDCSLTLVDLDNRTVVCYCSVGYRSSMVVEKVQEYYKKTGKVSQYL